MHVHLVGRAPTDYTSQQTDPQVALQNDLVVSKRLSSTTWQSTQFNVHALVYLCWHKAAIGMPQE